MFESNEIGKKVYSDHLLQLFVVICNSWTFDPQKSKGGNRRHGKRACYRRIIRVGGNSICSSVMDVMGRSAVVLTAKHVKNYYYYYYYYYCYY